MIQVYLMKAPAIQNPVLDVITDINTKCNPGNGSFEKCSQIKYVSYSNKLNDLISKIKQNIKQEDFTSASS